MDARWCSVYGERQRKDGATRTGSVSGGKGDAEGTLSVPWLMIRDDTRHSSLSDVRLDCRYCSLSFISFAIYAAILLNTPARINATSGIRAMEFGARDETVLRTRRYAKFLLRFPFEKWFIQGKEKHWWRKGIHFKSSDYDNSQDRLKAWIIFAIWIRIYKDRVKLLNWN